MQTTTGESLKILHPYTFDTTVFGSFRAVYLGRDKSDQFVCVLHEGAHLNLRLPVELITAISPAKPRIPRCPEEEK